MKYINKFSLILSLFAVAVLISCDDEMKKATYNETGNGLTFSSSTLSSVTVSPNDPTFTIDIMRANTKGALSGNVSMTNSMVFNKKTSTLEGCTVSGFSFADGEAKTSVKVDVSPLPIGATLTLNLTLNGSESGREGSITASKITVEKDYTWISLGKGKFSDKFTFGDFTYDVEVQKADGFERWRILNPYVAGHKSDDGENGDWIASSSASDITWWNIGDGLVQFNAFFIGLNYEADSKQPINAQPPQAFEDIDPSHNKWIDDKTVQLAPYYYITGLGGWDRTQNDDIITIKLP